VSRDDDGHGPEGGAHGDGVPPEPQHVEVRRAAPAGPPSVFGETPISRPPSARRQLKSDAEEEEPQTGPEIAMWIRRAALVAALRTGAQACFAGVFFGLCLGCFLGGLLPGGGAVMLGMLLAIASVPVGILGGVSTYRQTIESERTRQGLCRRCGYDLRGINTERCPECGTRLRLRRPWLQEPERPNDEDESA
jgi:hypothetical protein